MFRLSWMASLVPVAPALAADLTVTPADPSHIRLWMLSDTHCPGHCDSLPRRPDPQDPIPCCDTWSAIIENRGARSYAPDFTFNNGDLYVTSDVVFNPWKLERFFGYWKQIPSPKGYGMGNHEADYGRNPHGGGFHVDPENHFAPANWFEPAFGCDSSTPIEDCRRWYSVYIGAPPRVALLVTNNNNDSDSDIWYNPCMVPWDGLHTYGSAQRQWFRSEIESLPGTVEVVFVAGHRTYYGVEDYFNRPNILTNTAGESVRTHPSSFLREVESIHDHPNVKQVFMINGDQHCFSQTVPIRENVADPRGVVYVTLGISGGENDRNSVFPVLGAIPPGTLAHAFDDNWGSVDFEITDTEVIMSVYEAYADTLLYDCTWPFESPVAVHGNAPVPEGIRVRPNPASDDVEIAFSAPGRTVEEIAVYDTAGRRVRSLGSGGFALGEFRRTWDARDESGRRVASGRYFVCVRSQDARMYSAVTIRR